MRFEIGKINIICTDAERSLRFYCDLLGFELLEEECGAYHLRCGSTAFLLLPCADALPESAPYCSVPEFSIDLMVDDIGAAHSWFVEAGAEFASEWHPADRSFHVRDPDGLVFEVIEKKQRPAASADP